ncbi:MAG UNVERIFIED_CONTAM: hypothetical protein LVT10_06045 [Anaerolineae bacterium]
MATPSRVIQYLGIAVTLVGVALASIPQKLNMTTLSHAQIGSVGCFIRLCFCDSLWRGILDDWEYVAPTIAQP